MFDINPLTPSSNPTTAKMDLISAIKSANQELILDVKADLLKSFTKETKSLSNQLTNYHEELQDNIRKTNEHQAKIINLEKQVTSLHTKNNKSSTELSTLKEINKQMEKKL